MAASGAIVNFLTVQQASDYVAEVKRNHKLFTLIRESFKLRYDLTKGITKDEMAELINSTSDPDLKAALKDLKLLGDSKTLLTLDNRSKRTYRKALAFYARRSDGKYDVLVVFASQIKELAVDKLVACGLGSVCAGIAAGVCTMNPIMGVGAAVAIAAGSGAKAAYDYTKEMPDVLCGYILEELVQKQILKIEPNRSIQFAIN